MSLSIKELLVHLETVQGPPTRSEMIVDAYCDVYRRRTREVMQEPGMFASIMGPGIPVEADESADIHGPLPQDTMATPDSDYA